MAAWQATLDVVLPTDVLPPEYREGLARVLPAGSHWDASGERWGVEGGDEIDVFPGPPAEISARFDLRGREWRPDLYERFLAFAQTVGGRLHDPDRNIDLVLTYEAVIDSLRTSRAARFVRDPQAYFEELRVNPVRMPEEP